MQQNFRLIYPPDYDVSSEVHMKDFKFIQSLQIDDMVILKKESYRGGTDLTLEKFFTTDPEVLDYRLSIVEDLVENPALYKVFCKSVSVIYNINDMRRVLSSDFTMDSALGSVRYLEMYQEIVNLFADALKNCDIRSEGMKNFREQILEITESEEYQNLNKELSKMEMNFGYLKSVTIGVNLDENLRPKEAGILSVNQEPFRAGTIMDKLLRKKSSQGNVLMSSLYPLAKGLHGEDLKTLNYSLSSSLSDAVVCS